MDKNWFYLINPVMPEIIRNSYNDQIVETIFQKMFQNLEEEPFSDSDKHEFMSVYDSPLIYSDIGLDIQVYHSFHEMCGNPLGDKIIIASFLYKRAQNLLADLINRLLLINCGSIIIPILKKVYKSFEDRYEKDILENYYEYYRSIQLKST